MCGHGTGVIEFSQYIEQRCPSLFTAEETTYVDLFLCGWECLIKVILHRHPVSADPYWIVEEGDRAIGDFPNDSDASPTKPFTALVCVEGAQIPQGNAAFAGEVNRLADFLRLLSCAPIQTPLAAMVQG